MGAPADFVLVDSHATELVPGDLVANLVYAANGGLVDSTVIAGRVVMRHRVVDGEDEVRAHALECAHRVRAVD